MAKYKLINSGYSSFTIGKIYDETSHGNNALHTVKTYVKCSPNDWQLITNNMKNYIMFEGNKIPLSEETIESIRNSKKELTLNDILVSRKDTKLLYYISTASNNLIKQEDDSITYHTYINHFTNKQRAKQLQAISLMMIVADYLNDKELLYCDNTDAKYLLYYNSQSHLVEIDCYTVYSKTFVHFTTEKLAEQAIKILGEDTIKLALTGQGDLTNYNLD